LGWCKKKSFTPYLGNRERRAIKKKKNLVSLECILGSGRYKNNSKKKGGENVDEVLVNILPKGSNPRWEKKRKGKKTIRI